MKTIPRFHTGRGACLISALAMVLSAAGLPAQQSIQRATPAVGAGAAMVPTPPNWTTAEDHQHMLGQLGIKALRPGPSAYEQAPVGAGKRHPPADRPTPRSDANSMTAHAELVEKTRKGRIDVYFVGDSIVRRWGATDYPELLANWTVNFFGWNAADFGWGADRTENILWRLANGELDGVTPKVIVVLAGTNNVGAQPGDDAKVADITRGLKAIRDVCRKKAPGAVVILTAIFPRNDNIAVVREIDRINKNVARLANGKKVRYLNVNDKLADKDGRLLDGMMNAGDKLHPTVKGYQVWADGLKPILAEILGPPSATDAAPPPTGDPSAAGRRGATPPVKVPGTHARRLERPKSLRMSQVLSGVRPAVQDV